jgi:ketosteroid isomerase-like protein
MSWGGESMKLSNDRFTSTIAIITGAALLLVTAAALRVRAQAASQDEVLRMQKKFQDASVAGDGAAVGAMMADDAIFVHGNGAMQSKPEFLAAMANGQLALSQYDLSNPKVVLFDGGAIVTGIVDIAFKVPPNAPPGPPRVLHMRGSSVWQHKSTGWQLVLDQDTPIQGPPPAPRP